MFDSKGQVQSIIHVSETAYSDGDDFKCFFNDLESKFMTLQPRLTAVSILTDPNHKRDGKNADNRVDSQHFTQKPISLTRTHITKILPEAQMRLCFAFCILRHISQHFESAVDQKK